MLGTQGLRNVSRAELERLLRAVHRGDLPCPIDNIGLGIAGLLRVSDEISILRGLDARGVKAVLISVIAERR